jgi:DNA-directed RNA polymerase subunit M/transcription elongation factor TFIIS
MHKIFGILFLVCILSAALPQPHRAPRAFAAEFDIDGGRVVLRRLQYCSDCGSALLVTDVRAGELVRCPDCGREQTRLENSFLLTQLYQICKLCSGPLNPEGHNPGDVVECATCGTRQPLVADAFVKTGHAGGLGYRPGFPPGTGKKTLLLSPNRSDTAITAVPLDAPEPATAEPPLPDSPVLTKIPAPPPGFTREKPAARPVPPLPEIAPPGQTTASRPARPPSPGVVEVPAVTADLFGGAQKTRENESGYISSGNIVARVDGQPIRARDVDLVVLPVMERLRKQTPPADAATLDQRERELRREVLNRLIDRELAVREAAALGHRPDPAAVRAREAELAQMLAGSGIDLRREAERDIVMTDMRKQFAERFSSVAPNEVREFYQRHKGEMRQPRLIALDQLVVYEERASRPDRRPAREIAFDIASALEQGAPFEELRQRHDEFLPAADLPHAPPALKPESAYSGRILAAGGDLRKGAVFGPVPVSAAYIFGKVADVRPAGPIPFAEAENSIRTHLETQAADTAFAAWLAGLRSRARIESP